MLASGSGGNGSGRLRTISSSVRGVGRPVQQVEADVGGEPCRADAESGEPVDVGDPAVAGQAPVRAEPGVGVDGACPPVAEPDVVELREGDEEVRGEPAVGLPAGPRRPASTLRPKW